MNINYTKAFQWALLKIGSWLRRSRHFGITLILAALCTPIIAATNNSSATSTMTTISVPIHSSSSQDLQHAFKQALTNVLIKVSGNPAVMTLAQIRSQLTNISHNIVLEFSFSR